ncbi:hypothetical protein C8Q80DRAFT_1079688, partial [Daedaleopsis nitida]
VPTEVAELVVDELCDDYRALRSCTLTCQAWLPRSRAHLFRTVRIEDVNTLESLILLL